MRRPWGSAILLAAAAIGLAALDHFGPGGLYTFNGHGRVLNDAVHGCLWLLFLTHVALAGIMWTQRGRWDGAESSVYRFVGMKAIFWAFLAVTTPRRNGISLPYAYLLVLIILTTVDLDIQLVRRYVLRRRGEQS